MKIFEDLFVLEIANNHLGDLNRGLEIIKNYTQLARFNNIKCAIKLQIRDIDAFIHKDFKESDLRYIKKTINTKLTRESYKELVEAIRKGKCMPMATPFDEASVDLCVELGLPVLKIASSDVNDWYLIQKICETGKPTIISTGGSSLKDLDDIVSYFEKRNVPLAINHCVAIYPSEDYELDLNQIDFLRKRYPNHVIGLSTHEYHDWQSSMFIAYAKGARTFERHVDIEGTDVSPYCSLPHQIDEWFKAYHKTKEMCGASSDSKRIPPEKEIKYLDALVRGAYAKYDLEAGHVLTDNDLYLAIPLQKGQLSCREFMAGEKLIKDIKKDCPVYITNIDSPDIDYSLIMNRGI